MLLVSYLIGSVLWHASAKCEFTPSRYGDRVLGSLYLVLYPCKEITWTQAFSDSRSTNKLIAHLERGSQFCLSKVAFLVCMPYSHALSMIEGFFVSSATVVHVSLVKGLPCKTQGDRIQPGSWRRVYRPHSEAQSVPQCWYDTIHLAVPDAIQLHLLRAMYGFLRIATN